MELALDLSEGPGAGAATAPGSAGGPSPVAASPLTDVLTALGERVAPISLARERTLPLPPDLTGFFPEGGLTRGRSVHCTGPSATSLALSLVAPAVAGGCWLALIDLPTIGLDAASEYGVPLERVVRVDTIIDTTVDTTVGGVDGGEEHRWADVVAAATDGFDVLMVRVPAGVSPTVMRKVTTRVQQRGAVVVVLGASGSMVCDAELSVDSSAWHGVTTGAGYLRERTITVRSGGRRMYGGCHEDLLLPAVSQGRA